MTVATAESKPNVHRGGFQIVVDRFRNADAIDARFLQLQRSGHGAVAADDDQRFDAILFQNCARIGDDFASTTVRSPAPTFAAKCPRFVVPMIVPPRGMMPAVLRRSRMTKFPGGKQTFEAIEKAENFQIQFFRGEHDAAQHGIQSGTIATARQNADAGLRHLRDQGSESFLRIRPCGRRRPTDRKAASPAPEFARLPKAIWAGEQDDDEMTRINPSSPTFLDDFRFAMRGEHQTIAGARSPAGLDTIDAVHAEKFVRVTQHITQVSDRRG